MRCYEMLPHLKEGDWGRGVGREGADGRVGGVGLTVGPNVPSKARGGGPDSWFLPIHSHTHSTQVQQAGLRRPRQASHCPPLKPFSSRMNSRTQVLHPPAPKQAFQPAAIVLQACVVWEFRWPELRASPDIGARRAAALCRLHQSSKPLKRPKVVS